MEDRNRTENPGNEMNRDREQGNMGEQKKPAQGQQGQQDRDREGQQGNQQDRDRKQA
jgi:hypothetical protein